MATVAFPIASRWSRASAASPTPSSTVAPPRWRRRCSARRADLGEARVAFLIEPSIDYVLVQRGVWRAGGVAVPLCASHPPPELDYVLADAQPELVVASPGARRSSATAGGGARDRAAVERRGGQGRRRRGAWSPASARARSPRDDRLHQRHHRQAQGRGHHARRRCARRSASLIEAWEWTPDDRIVLTLPLHHVHGIVNVLGCALGRGRRVRVLHPSFDAERVWERSRAIDSRCSWRCRRSTSELIQAWEQARRAATRAHGRRCAQAAPDGVGLRRAARDRARALARDHRPHPARALRHDRDRHGPVESAAR